MIQYLKQHAIGAIIAGLIVFSVTADCQSDLRLSDKIDATRNQLDGKITLVQGELRDVEEIVIRMDEHISGRYDSAAYKNE